VSKKEEDVMKRKVLAGVLLGFFFTSTISATPITKIQYQATDIGSGRWQYSYEVTNISLTPAIEEFTIWFNYGLYDNLSIETPDPPAGDWDEIVIQPEPVLEDDGYYDALALGLGIGIGNSVSGFAVSFDWLGVGEPGSQLYEIIDPATFDTLDSGYTIPEPTTLLLLTFGGMILRRKKLATKRYKKF
jgi:hypothetical protein